MKNFKINFIVFIDIINKNKFLTTCNAQNYLKKKINNTVFKYKNIDISSCSHRTFTNLKNKEILNINKNYI